MMSDPRWMMRAHLPFASSEDQLAAMSEFPVLFLKGPGHITGVVVADVLALDRMEDVITPHEGFFDAAVVCPEPAREQ
jgi:hypothetical protein